MGKDKKTKIILLSILILFLSVSITASVSAYGGDGGTPADGSGGPPVQTNLSDKAILNIFSVLDAKSRAEMLKIFSGSDYTSIELMRIRQTLLEQQMSSAHTGKSIMDGLTVTVEFLDKAGQWSQFGLSFVPGVGWVTSGLLDTARGGADAYRDGKSAEEILKEATIAGLSSVTINKLSPLGADKSFNNAKSAYNIATKGSGKQTGKAVKIFIKNVGSYGTKKEAERRTGDALKNALNNAGNQAPNRSPAPVYMGPGGYDTTPMGTKVYK